MTTAGPAATRTASSGYAAPWGVRAYVTDLGGPVHWIEFVPEAPETPGTAGAPGTPGTAGTAGGPGTAGTAGAPGTAGTAGAPGTPETAGAPGTPGTAGTAGTAGAPETPETSNGPRPSDQALATDRDPGQPPPIVFVHGLGGSHLNWCLLGPHLVAGRRAVALDLRGFGLTPGRRVNSTVQANARLLDRFITEVIGTPVILIGNSMGGLITILETAANPNAVAGAVLIDPALPLPPQKPDWGVSGQFLLYALPGLGEAAVAKFMRTVSPETAVQQILELVFADPSRADPEMIKADVALLTRRHPATRAQASARARIFLAAARSLLRVLSRRQRYAGMMAGIDVPVLLIGGEADRVIPVAAMRQAAARNPRWDSVILAGVGHTPMLEVPDVVTSVIRDWLTRTEGGPNHAAADRT